MKIKKIRDVYHALSDEGHNIFVPSLGRYTVGRDYDVFLDGKLVTNCTGADEKEGFVTVLVCKEGTSGGIPLYELDLNGKSIIKKLTGKVEIKLKENVTTNV